MTRLWSFVVVTLVALAAHPAFACAVCGGAKADNDWAFGMTTLVLSIAPPLLFGGMVFFVVRAVRKRNREEEAASVSTPAE